MDLPSIVGLSNDSSKDCDKGINGEAVYRKLTMAIAVAGVIVGGVVLIFIVPCAKAYKTFLQRIVIFIVLSMLSEDMCRIFGSLFETTQTQQRTCEVLGFITLMFHWCTYLLAFVWLLYLLAVVCVRTKQDSIVVVTLKNSKRLRLLLEVLVITTALFGPAVTILWTPVYSKDYEYGFDGNICAIKALVDKSNLSTPALLLGQLYNYTPIVLTGLVSLILSIGVTVVYFTMSTKLRRAKQAIKNLVALSFLIIGFLLTFIVVSLILHTIKCNNLVVYGLNTTFTTLGKFVIVIGYFMVFHCNRKKTKRASNNNNNNNMQEENKEYGTFRESSRESAPSDTRFTIHHTGEFSDSHTHDVTGNGP